MIFAVEDAVSEAALAKILARQDVSASVVLGRKGNEYLRKKCRELNRAAGNQTVVLLTDLDNPTSCPASLRADWLRDKQNERFLFRVAVVEVEAWLLADHMAFAEFAGIAPGRVPATPDDLPDPKRTLVNLCRRSPIRAISKGMVPAPRSTAAVGPEYNPRLTGFIAKHWDPDVAVSRSPSLARSVRRIDEHVKHYFTA